MYKNIVLLSLKVVFTFYRMTAPLKCTDCCQLLLLSSCPDIG